jgi:hypothetical protein
MTNARRAAGTAALALALTAAVALMPSHAVAQGRGHGHGGGHGGGGAVHVGGFYGYGPGWGYGFSPWWAFGSPWGAWGPYGYYPANGGVDMNVAMMTGYGAVELNVKPNRADVWVDGKWVGEARDLDGYPSYLWLSDGPHRVAVYKGGFETFDEEISVQRGMKTEIKVRLEPGDSAPPGPKPDQKAADERPKK